MKKKIYLNTNVYEEAIKRITRLYNEFDEVVVGFSGGKDSTVTLELAIKVATTLNRLPVKTIFIDQEGEWQATIDYIKKIMNRPEVEPMWYQMPLMISNSTSHTENWLQCWEEGKNWIRDKDPISIKENTFGTLRFYQLFNEILKQAITSKKACLIGGVRSEESPARTNALTNSLTYKDIAWGKGMTTDSKIERYIFYPLYDWSYTDIWKCINDNSWDYCKLYDNQYRYGIPVVNMRLSSVHHETAVTSLHYMQEVEPDTFEKIQQRIEGINTEKTLMTSGYTIAELPYMFNDWEEYRKYLMKGLIKNTDHQHKLSLYDRKVKKHNYLSRTFMTDYNKCFVKAILKNDYHSVTLNNFFINPIIAVYAMWKQGKITNPEQVNNIYIREELNGKITK